MKIIIPCHSSKQIICTTLFNRDISDMIMKYIIDNENKEEIRFRISNTKDFNQIYGDLWECIMSFIRLLNEYKWTNTK